MRGTGGSADGALTAFGGPLGAYASARARSWAATVAWLLVGAAATMGLGVAERAHCIAGGWSGQDQFWHACFSDLPALYQLGHLDAGLGAYVTGDAAVRLDHPVLTGSVMTWLGGLVPAGAVVDQQRWYFTLWAVLGTALVMVMVCMVAAARPRHAADAAHLALSPVLALTALVAPDLLGVALATAGVWAWSRRRPLLAGALLGLAVAARTYPLLILLALLLLGARTGRMRQAGEALAAAVGAAALVLLPFLVANPEAVLRPYRVWWDAIAGLGSMWMVPQLLGRPLPAVAATALTVVGLLLALGSGALFALGTWRRPTLAEVAFVLVGLALVTGKAFPVQASLWLVPLVALCGVRWRDHLIWAAAEAMHFVAVWLYVGGLSKPDRGMPPEWYLLFLLLRIAAVLYLVWRVWHTAALRPEAPVPDLGDHAAYGLAEDPHPDRDAVVEELAGPFADAPDRLLVRLG